MRYTASPELQLAEKNRGRETLMLIVVIATWAVSVVGTVFTVLMYLAR